LETLGSDQPALINLDNKTMTGSKETSRCSAIWIHASTGFSDNMYTV